MTLFPFVVFIVLAFTVLTGLLALYLRWIAERALTRPFREAEMIINGGIPDEWVAQINRRITPPGPLRLFRRQASGTALALAKIDRLERFFQRSPFFENEEARQLLLAQLQVTADRWANMAWPEILAERGR